MTIEKRLPTAKQILQKYLDVDKIPMKGNEWIIDTMWEFSEIKSKEDNLSLMEEIEKLKTVLKVGNKQEKIRQLQSQLQESEEMNKQMVEALRMAKEYCSNTNVVDAIDRVLKDNNKQK